MMLWQILALVVLIPLAIILLTSLLVAFQEQAKFSQAWIKQQQTPVQKHAATAPMPYYMQLQLKKHQENYYQQFSKKQDYS